MPSLPLLDAPVVRTVLRPGASMAVSVPFAVRHMTQPLKLDYLWAALCLAGAVFFMFRG